MKTKMSSHDYFIVEAVWLILLIADITATITQGPSNAVAEIGMQVKLTCVADAPIGKWFLSKDGTEVDKLTIVGPGCSTVNSPFGDHYTAESSEGGKTCNLIVFNITMEQAGVYRCLETPNNFFSILTVIENSPTATYNTTENVVVENDNVIITCSLNHNGSVGPALTLRPYFYWKDSYGGNVNSSYDWTTENTAVSQITVTAERKDIRPYSCHVYLQLIPPSSPNYAINTPTVESSASSPTIEVLYGPDLGSLSRYTEVIEIGGTACAVGVISFGVTGNPPPSYEWFDDIEKVSISNERILDLAEIFRSYTFVAYNTIRNEVNRAIVSMYQPSEDTTIPHCRFPRKESTWLSVIPVEGCDSGTCACSSGSDGFILVCNGNYIYPNALHQWIGADNCVTDSKLYANAQTNGIYRCTAYFDQASSNYTGNVVFPSGTSAINITECNADMSSMCPAEPTDTDSNSSEVAIIMFVLFGISFAVNIAILIIWVYNQLRAKQDKVRRTESVRQPETVDLSTGTSEASAYEGLRRPDETQLQQSAYETLVPSPTRTLYQLSQNRIRYHIQLVPKQ